MFRQCCGTVMIYCGSGSYFEKVLVRVRFPVPVADPDLVWTVYNNNKILQKHCFPECWPLIFYFFFLYYGSYRRVLLCWIWVQIRFRTGNGSGSETGTETDPEPECITDSVLLRQEVAVPAVPVPFPLWFYNTVCRRRVVSENSKNLFLRKNKWVCFLLFVWLTSCTRPSSGFNTSSATSNCLRKK